MSYVSTELQACVSYSQNYAGERRARLTIVDKRSGLEIVSLEMSAQHFIDMVSSARGAGVDTGEVLVSDAVGRYVESRAITFAVRAGDHFADWPEWLVEEAQKLVGSDDDGPPWGQPSISRNNQRQYVVRQWRYWNEPVRRVAP